ncbi:hypothetical protein [Cyanobium sp. Morenito 9A2]|uniref:hypothetical protein n=1 Tax=Cyanobium sp. Morenito 9A2 TaxID=2823718 RepID=UPI0020CE8547|nr:hypothetical protein [Cyanobium sp. Morenito 9A2]MCP9850817.1 hypothetical protein [Cyanobium sp. Morenito 9A2]
MSSLRGLIRSAALMMMAGTMGGAIAVPAAGGPPASPVTLTFAGQTYLLRWSLNHQHEFTPPGQDDLSRWRDMVTINTYPGVSDGEGLAQVANRVLDNYRRNRAMVLRTSSIPRTAQQPAEHLIVALFSVRDSSEAVFARWRLADGRGTAVVYSHRLQGPEAAAAMAAWLKTQGTAVERSLMSLREVPSHRLLEPTIP